MHCMKCGSEIPEEQVFCDNCLAIMEAYPVKPDTVVQIQKRPERPERKYQKKVPAAETIRRQRRALGWLSLILVVVLIGFGLVTGILLNELAAAKTGADEAPVGQNYTATDGVQNVSRETSAPTEAP